ncbi:MAG TPA: cytochrome-c peroxidase [Cytophagaceae bacterium]
MRIYILLGVHCLAVSCSNDVKTTRDKREANTINDLGALPTTYKEPPDNISNPAKIELGRMLFYDPILSGNRDVSCATCHHPEFGYAESLDISIGVNGRGIGHQRSFAHPNDIPFTKRNSQTILNTAFNGIDVQGKYDPQNAPMFWDLRSKSLELQALEPIKSFEEMRGHGAGPDSVLNMMVKRLKAIPEYHSLFEKAFGDRESITIPNLGKAIASFERSLVANNSRFDLYMRGDSAALSTFEKDGLQVFLNAGCAKCHNGPMLSDYNLHVLGVIDNEKLLQSDSGANNFYAFRTPSLRNLKYTSPYMHSGKLKTLENVLEFYEDLQGKDLPNPHVSRAQLDPLVKELDLEFKDIRLIVEFLNSLNDDQFDRKIPAKVPSGLKVGGEIQ